MTATAAQVAPSWEMKQAAEADRQEHPNLILTPVEAARTLSLSVSTLARMRIAGDGPTFVRLSRQKVGYRPSDLEAFVAGRTRTSTSQN